MLLCLLLPAALPAGAGEAQPATPRPADGRPADGRPVAHTSTWTSAAADLRGAADPAAGPAAATDPGAEERWTARLQTTWVRQRKAAFAQAYEGPNSLSAAREWSYTFTTSAHFGVRAWRGGELYLNPEVTQGIPLSELTGLGGFTNGEATRASGATPTLYRQRLFLRQTWNLGGGRERVEPDLNQLGGHVDRNRLVLTAGNFSLLDVFDDNAYAHDPRRQFLNWSLMTHGAYDYAADARGFGWGFALEWHHEDWSLRAGRMTPPREPNMQRIDPRFFRHYGDQVELERRYEIAGRPGSARLLGYRNRAVLGRYRDAIEDGLARGETPDVFRVRGPARIKHGVGLNLEQSLSRDLGVFFRAMGADGATETLSFTEVDRSVAAGLSFAGAAWGRPQDTLGLAFARNHLSRDRRDYLAAGGISFFIGDGALRYRPENIVEAYYSWAVARGLWLSLDYQRIRNPAYNADRGPANVTSLRLHAQY